MTANKQDRIDCVVLGATGMVGQRFIALLDGHPQFRVAALCASEGRVGKEYGQTVHWLGPTRMPESSAAVKLESADPEVLKKRGIRIAFSALPSSAAREQEDAFVKAGIHVFSNASVHRMDPDVPILIPEVNPGHVELARHRMQQNKGAGALVTNANCTVTGLAMGLAPLREIGFKRVWVASYQALSGAGYPGLSALDVTANVIPFIRGEEEKVETECLKILGTCTGPAIEPYPIEVEAHCVRVAVPHGHLEAVSVEMAREVSREEIVKCFEDSAKPSVTEGLPLRPEKAVRVTTAEDRPQPLRDAWIDNGMSIVVGRIKVDGNRLRFKLLVNNIIRGAAGCSVINAELCLREGLLEA